MIEKLLFVFLVTCVSAYVEAADSNGQEESGTELLGDLSDLTSSDAEVRRTSLTQLVLEIRSGFGRTEGQYSNHGQALLPALHQVILDLDDPHASKALEAIHWMGVSRLMVEQINRRDPDNVDRRELEEQLDKISHYPVPSAYPPLKDALINVLKNSQRANSRTLAALTLANSFHTASDVEDVLVARLPIEESNWKVQSAIVGSLSTITERHSVKRSTELALIKALASSNMRTRRSAVDILRRHQFEGALEGVINSLTGDSTAIEFDEKLSSISFFKDVDASHISGLENAAAAINDETRKKDIHAIVQTLKHRTTDIDHHFGLLELTQSSILLHTAHRGLVANTKIAVVGSDFALYVLMPVDSEEETSKHVRINSYPTATYYVGSFESTVAVESIENAVVYFPQDSTKYSASDLSHSSCTSNEGIHHSVWSVEGVENVRVWSAYQHLGYTTEPTCSDDEFAEQ